MTDSMPTTIGARVREARKRRGMTQRELASASGLSISLITKLEQGNHGGIRLETAHKIAIALQVTTTALMSEPDAAAPQHDDVTAWEPLLRALGDARDGQPDDAPTIGGLRDALADAVDAVLGSRYAELRATLPALVRDANTLVALSADGAALRARQARSGARQLAAYMLGQTWQFDAAISAIDLAITDASDDLTVMAAMDWKCWLLLRQGRLSESGRLAARAADECEPRLPKASPDELTAWGRLLIRVSAAAVRDNRPDEAREALRLARMAAGGMNRDAISIFNPWAAFGPVTVAMIRAENAIIQSRPDVTLTVASQIVGRDFPVPRNYLRHRLDVANAHVTTRQWGKAVGMLTQVRSAAPEWLAQQRYAGDIAAAALARSRVLTDEMRDLANFMSLPL